MAPHKKITPGDKYGRLTVIKEIKNYASYKRLVSCKCDCGTEKIFQFAMINAGTTKSCGCLRSERIRQKIKDMKPLNELLNNNDDVLELCESIAEIEYCYGMEYIEHGISMSGSIEIIMGNMDNELTIYIHTNTGFIHSFIDGIERDINQWPIISKLIKLGYKPTK